MLPGGPSAVLLPAETVERLLAEGETDVLVLLTMAGGPIAGSHGKVFALSPAAMERARVIGSWDKQPVSKRHSPLDRAELVGETYRAVEGLKTRRNTGSRKGGRFAPNLNQTPPPSLPRENL